MLEDINVRFFAYDYFNGEIDIVEISEQEFGDLAATRAPISYERHSVFANGCRQACLTLGCDMDGDLI